MLNRNSPISWTKTDFAFPGNFAADSSDLDFQKYGATAHIWESLREATLERLENVDCIREYSSTFSERRRHLILVLEEKRRPSYLDSRVRTHFANFAYSGKCGPSANNWICYQEFGPECQSWGEACSKKAQRINPQHWKTFDGFVPKYCLSETVPPICALRFSFPLALVVIVFNILKLVVLVVCCLPRGPFGKQQPLLTVGDAISSFLRNNDQTTRGLCAMGIRDLGRWTGEDVEKRIKVQTMNRRLGVVHHPWKRVRLFYTVLKRRWILLTLS
jgi:hypothetical protein